MLNLSKLTLIIETPAPTQRLDQVLASLLPTYSRSQIKAWIDAGFVFVNDQPATGKMKLKGGETVIVIPQMRELSQSAAQNIPLTIIHEDDSLLIINKPIGLVVHPGAGNPDNTLMNALLHHAPALRALPRAGILHRIDKNTSGLLAIAKTESALTHLGHQLKERTLGREYQAIVYGNMISGGTIDAPIDRHPIDRKRMNVSETGKPAITHYRVAERFPFHTLLNIKLETGRTHQIRVHLSHIHYPLIGDVAYGGRVQLKKGMGEELITALREFKRQALHAFALSLIHPDSGEMLRFEAPLPADMLSLLTVLRRDKNRKED